MPLCQLLVAYICVAITNVGPGNGYETTATVRESGLVGSATISAGQWKAEFFLHTDLILTLNPERMTQVCAAGHCLAYYRKCDNAERPTRCDFSVLMAGVNADPIHIEGDDEATMKSAIDRLSVVVDAAAGVTIPFSEMNQESNGPSPYCHYRRLPGNRFNVEPGCPLPN